ncbi:MAG: gliding motility protein, partial [Acidobacteria bacterium]|nr:gliding motility protein [Acidobacteriota bacterium]
KLLERLEMLLDQLLPEDGANVTRTGVALLTTLVREGVRDRSVRDLLRTSSQLLARKVIERVGESAEHYITSSRAEYFQMLRSAAGGGLLTTGTAMLKVLITSLKLPLFQEGLLASVNYAGSFLAMQFAGFTLATKQSSVTAAKLAGSIKVLGGELDASPIVAEIARVTRSQLAAIAGNLGMVIPGALLADFLVKSLTGHSYLNAEQAEYVLHSLDPFHTLTVFYAALTGVVLWSSSLAAGWLENWSAYRRIPEALASHRGIVKRLGGTRAARLSRWFAHNVSGLGGNVSIGLLLGMLPVFGKFLGLPIDVRHVTLSTGQMALAAGHLGRAELTSPEMLVAAFGILLIALCNFGVSFALALGVAMRARGVLLGETAGLVEALAIELVRNPRAFLLPPRKDEEASARPSGGAESTG